jgi:uncharacterized repeat protein (TIGR01451 family)
MTGIANVPVALKSIATREALVVYTDSTGDFAFYNVPDGDYRIIEAFREEAVPSPGDFSQAVVVEVTPAGVVPPISYVSNPPVGTTDLDCTAPNTLLITVAGANVANQYILNGPVRYLPIEGITDVCAVISPHNLLVDADYGTMGFFPQGTAANTGAPTEPFGGNVPDFDYVWPVPWDGRIHSPEDGEYTVQNILNLDESATRNVWWRVADRTTGNETGRMMIVNGDDPGAIFFSEEIAVTPYTFYLFGTWMINMMRITGSDWYEPAFGVRILDSTGAVIYEEHLGELIPTNTVVPEWRQVGTVINSYDHTSLMVQFVSEGPALWGNDYAIDDVSLQEVIVPVFIPVKSCDKRTIDISESATYTVTITNTCTKPLVDVTFIDIVAEGLSFVEDSVTINGLPMPGLNPETGFSLPDIPGESTATVTFKIMAEFLPAANPAVNRADITYKYSPVNNILPIPYEVSSNEVLLRIDPPWCEIDSLVLQRENNSQSIVEPDSIMTFDTPIVESGDIIYQDDGSIDITRSGAYAVLWYVAGMTGLSHNGQSYIIKRRDYDTNEWVEYSGAGNFVKISSTSSNCLIAVSPQEIEAHEKATFGLFNHADSNTTLTSFQPKSGIIVWGADFNCVQNRMLTVDFDLEDIYYEMRQIERFLYLSEVEEMLSETPEMAGLGVAVIFIGFSYNFWGIGALDEEQTFEPSVHYYLMESSQYPAILHYQGETTISTLWIERPNGAVEKYPVRFDESGIYITPNAELTLPQGTKFLFTQSLILAP